MGVKWGQMGSNGVKWSQMASNGVKWGQMEFLKKGLNPIIQLAIAKADLSKFEIQTNLSGTELCTAFYSYLLIYWSKNTISSKTKQKVSDIVTPSIHPSVCPSVHT
jgi:hypothetical protein